MSLVHREGPDLPRRDAPGYARLRRPPPPPVGRPRPRRAPGSPHDRTRPDRAAPRDRRPHPPPVDPAGGPGRTGCGRARTADPVDRRPGALRHRRVPARHRLRRRRRGHRVARPAGRVGAGRGRRPRPVDRDRRSGRREPDRQPRVRRHRRRRRQRGDGGRPGRCGGGGCRRRRPRSAHRAGAPGPSPRARQSAPDRGPGHRGGARRRRDRRRGAGGSELGRSGTRPVRAARRPRRLRPRSVDAAARGPDVAGLRRRGGHHARIGGPVVRSVGTGRVRVRVPAGPRPGRRPRGRRGGDRPVPSRPGRRVGAETMSPRRAAG